MFLQQQQPGQQGLVDFTLCKGLTIVIAGKVFNFRLFHFRLAYRKWSYLHIVQGGESYTALTGGIAEAFKRLGATPNENGAVESPHGHLKRRIEQQLQMRFPDVKDRRYHFDHIDDFQRLIDAVVAKHNRRNEHLLREELALMSPLPVARGVDDTQEWVKVSSSSTINLHRVTYSVPSRLIGERLNVRLFDDRLACYLGSTHAVSVTRLHPAGSKRARQIDYRHLIGGLARKPMAFYHASLRDDILPSDQWLDAGELSQSALRTRTGASPATATPPLLERVSAALGQDTVDT